MDSTPHNTIIQNHAGAAMQGAKLKDLQGESVRVRRSAHGRWSLFVD